MCCLIHNWLFVFVHAALSVTARPKSVNLSPERVCVAPVISPAQISLVRGLPSSSVIVLSLITSTSLCFF